MGLLALNRFMSFQPEKQRRRRRRGLVRAPTSTVASLANGKRGSSCRFGDSPQGGKRKKYCGPDLPEDIWRHIHSLMPFRDAARAACVSHAFLSSWRCRPAMLFSGATLNLSWRRKADLASDFNSKVDHILQNHLGIGLKTLEIEYCGYNADTCCYLNSWLAIAITPELEELSLDLPPAKAKYIFPLSLFSNGSGKSIRHLRLTCCAISGISSTGFDYFKNLTSLYLCDVRITGDDLGSILFSSVALERLELSSCQKIICLKIPSVLQRLSFLSVSVCDRLKMIENKAPNLSSFEFSGCVLPLGEPLHVKDVKLFMSCTISYACAYLPLLVPNLETLSLDTCYEVVNKPMVPRPFLHLKYLSITLSDEAFSPAYDCLSLVSFLGAAPLLESFGLAICELSMQHDSIIGDPSPLRQMAEPCHNNLKNVKVTGFCSAKCLVELICYIIESAILLDCLTLDTICSWGFPRCSDKGGECVKMTECMASESQKALLVVRKYIEGKVRPGVKLNVLGPCQLCHAEYL